MGSILLVYVCTGSEAEIKEWFQTINITGRPSSNSASMVSSVHCSLAVIRSMSSGLAVATTRPPPTPGGGALDHIAAWLDSPTLVLLGEGKGYFDVLKEVVQKGKVVGPRVHDARIAALCKNHGVTDLYSADRDFHRFAMIRVKNPLID